MWRDNGTDLVQDPYILRNHVGSIECRLCLTVHANEGSYLAHTQGKKHQTNLARRASKEAKDSEQQYNFNHLLMAPPVEKPKKTFIKIGRPGYRISKVREPTLDPVDDDLGRGREPVSGRLGLLFQVHLPEIKEGVMPLHRFMSSFEQRQEAPNPAWQYLLVAAEPYETIAFKLQSREIDHAETLTMDAVPQPVQRAEPGTFSHWDSDNKTYTIQVMFRR